MARPPKSDVEHALSGADAKDPARKRARRAAKAKVTGEGLGQPPAKFLDKYSPTAAQHLEAWKDIQAAADAAGVTLTAADRIDVEMLARVIARCRRPEPQSSDFASYDKFSTKLRLGTAGRKLIHDTADKAAGNTENDEWNSLTTPPAPPAMLVQ
jgi:hypothetical protein